MLNPLTSQRPASLTALLVFAACSGAAVALIKLLQINPLIPFAALYVLLFLYLSNRSPRLCLAFAFGLGLFPFDIGGGGIAVGPSEGHLALLTLVYILSLLTGRATLRLNPLFFPAVLYLGICVASATLHWWGSASIVSLVQMVLYLLLTVLLFSNILPTAKDYTPCFVAVVAAGVFLALATILSGSNYVFGLHKNAIGGATSYALIICCELWFSAQTPRRRALCGTTFLILAAGLFMSLSRGAWFSSILGVSVIVVLRRQFRLALVVALLAVPLIIALWSFLPESTKDYAGNFSSDRSNIAARFESLDYAKDRFEQSPILGFGVGLRKLFDATNVIFLTLAETGVAGLAAFLLLHLIFLAMTLRAVIRTPLTSPYFSLITIGAALIFAKFLHGCVDHYWSRGSLLVVWGAVGMAVKAYLASTNAPSRSPQ